VKNSWQILKNTQNSKVCIPFIGTSSTNNCHSHLLCQLLMSLTDLWSFFGKISNILLLSQRQKVNKIHFLIRGRIQKGQESLGPVLVMLLFNGSNAVYLKMIGQISLVFLLFSVCLFLLFFFAYLFLQSFLFH